MKNSSKRISYIILFFIVCMFMMNEKVFAGSGSLTWRGDSQVNVGATLTQDIMITGVQGNAMGIGGQVTVDDTSCIEFLSIAKVDGASDAEGAKFSYLSLSGTSTDTTIVRVTFKAGASTCTTNINIVSPTISFTDNTHLKPENIGKTITVVQPNIPAPKSNDATLKRLVPDNGSLTPVFTSGTTSYTLSVEAEVDKISFLTEVNHAAASVESGATCNLSGPSTQCRIVVRAEDGSKKTYVVTVTRPEKEEEPGDEPSKDSDENPEEKSADATLKTLDVSGFTLMPSFKKEVTTYSINVPNNINGLNVEAIASDPEAKVKIEGNLGWKDGINPITITVTATDGTKKVYTVNANRKSLNNASNKVDDPEASDNYLKSLVISEGSLSPDFDKYTSNYKITVPRGTTNLKIDAIPNNEKAKVSIEGNDNLKLGNNTVIITVIASDGSKRTYTIDVHRSEQEGDNLLEDLFVEGYTIAPTFNPTQIEYEVEVGNIDEVNVKAIAKNKKAKIEIIGNKNLKEGRNLVQVKVTDEKGFTKTYFLYVNKTSKKTFLGLTLGQWLTILGILLLVGLLLFIIFLLLKKKEKKEEKTELKQAPVIEFKPEFNFGSKNGTDDDVVNEGGVLNQYTGFAPNTKPQEDPKVLESKSETVKEIEYNPYDAVVTKDELFDAIEEARKTKDPSKFKMLYEQELLNRKKAELKAKEESLNTEERR